MKPTRRPRISLVTETGCSYECPSPHNWWSTLKSAVLSGEGGGLMCESVAKADLLSDHFDSKQSREAVDLPLTCHPSPRLTTFAFRSSEVGPHLLDLDPSGGTDPLGMFPLFLKKLLMLYPHPSQCSVSAACSSG